MTSLVMRLKMTRVAHDGPTQAAPAGQTAFRFAEDAAAEQTAFGFTDEAPQDCPHDVRDTPLTADTFAGYLRFLTPGTPEQPGHPATIRLSAVSEVVVERIGTDTYRWQYWHRTTGRRTAWYSGSAAECAKWSLWLVKI